MIGRVVEIAEDGRHLAMDRGFMTVRAAGDEIARIPLDDIAVVLANAHGLTYSNNLLVALAQRGVGMVVCGANHLPVAWLWPVEGHHVQAARMAAQVEAPRPLCKRLWQSVVRAKIEQQAAVLSIQERPSGGFELLARQVRSGDPDNIEAQAARRYWPLLMGPDFRRDRRAGGVNTLLNYAYTILRSAAARAVVAAGLHPSVGIHHSNRYDALRLADDIMEPFRPIADLACARLADAGLTDLTRETKQELAGLLHRDMRTARGTTPIVTCLERLAVSLAQAFEKRTAELDFPLVPLPLDVADVGRPAKSAG